MVLITGGSSGIGNSIGIYLKSKGCTVYGTTRNVSKHPDFNAFELLELEVTDPDSITKAVENVISREGRLDVLINNAGVGIAGPIEETPQEEIVKAFDTNFNGPINMIKNVLPQMRKQGTGRIINITSLAGHMGLPYRGIYSATKGAMEVATEALRMETKDFGIHISNLAPGDFATNIASGRYHVPIVENSPYREPYDSTLKIMNDHVDNGQDPVRVAEKVLQIINTSNPKAHYCVGSATQRFSLVLKKILPDKVYERLLLRHYKL